MGFVEKGLKNYDHCTVLWPSVPNFIQIRREVNKMRAKLKALSTGVLISP
jgi:hypothetical protein